MIAVIALFVILSYILLYDAVTTSPYPIIPFFEHATLGKVIFLNPFTWNNDVLTHEIAHAIRGDPGENDHDAKFWETYKQCQGERAALSGTQPS